MTPVRLVWAAALVATLGVSSAAGQGLDDSLQDSVARGCTGSRSVIIRTTPGAREALRKSLVSQGRRVNGEFPSLDAISAEVRCEDLNMLAGFGHTASVSDNAAVHSHQSSLESGWGRLMEAVSAQQHQTNLFSTLGVRQTPLGTLARYVMPPVGVAIVDSGIQPGPDFGSRITAFYDFTHGDIRPATPSDEYGHGTHVAGLVGSTYVGVAPSARLIGLKVLDGEGKGTTDNVIRAIEFAIVNKEILNIDVINLSLGHPIFESAATDPLVQAVEHASRAGIVVVVSAGNAGRHPLTGQIGYGGISSPGNAPSGISVASLRTFGTVSRSDDRVAAYSSRGPSRYDSFAKPDISAPGDNLLSVAAAGSTLRLAQESRGNAGNYMRLSGTSMAAGIVSGMVALVLQTNQNLTPNALKMVIQYSSIPVTNDDGTPSDVLSHGAGSINGTGAVALARAINPTLAPGQKWLLTSVTPVSVIGGQSYVWVQRMVWGNHIATGAGIIDEQRPAWALNIVWGEGFADDDNIVWGNLFDDDDNIVWGNLFDDDDNIVWGNLFDDDDNIVWGNLFDDDDNIVWGNSALLGSVVNLMKGVN